VAVRPQAQRRLYRLDPSGLAELRDYADQMWTDALDAYARSFEE
jgi:hypothetical protein